MTNAEECGIIQLRKGMRSYKRTHEKPTRENERFQGLIIRRRNNDDRIVSWLERAIALGFETSDEPVAGSVFVTDSHVGVVEKYENGIWMISESGYGNVIPWTYGEGIYKSGNTWYAMHATYHEIYKFVLIPDVTPGPPSTGILYDRTRRRDRYYYYEY